MTFKILLDEINLNIQKIIEQLGLPQTSFVIEPAKSNFGDVMCNVSFLLSKHLKKKPSEVAQIISSGTKAPGTILELCNTDFIEKFNNADVVISKGQGNYEGLSDVKRSVFFLLKAKCYVIARDLNVNEDDIILKAINI